MVSVLRVLCWWLVLAFGLVVRDFGGCWFVA